MLALSQTAGYAILALACLEGPGGAPIQVKDLAEHTGIARPYLAKLIHSLAAAGLVETRRGHGGGVVLARSPEGIALSEVLDAVDGPGVLEGCLLGLEECSDERACPLHSFWKPMRLAIAQRLSSMTLAEVAEFEHARRTTKGQRHAGHLRPHNKKQKA